MKNKTVVCLAVVAVAVVILFPLRTALTAAAGRSRAAAASQPALAAQPAGAAPEPAASPDPQRGRHPNVVAALRALENARNHLQNATHHYDGHRAKALQRTNDAINQCQQALEWARRH